MSDDFYHVVELLPTLNVHHYNAIETELRIKKCKMFESARDVGIYMWGRSTGMHLIYKNGKLAVESYQYKNISELENFLEGYI